MQYEFIDFSYFFFFLICFVKVVTAREPLLAERENQESTSKKMVVGRESWCPRKSAKANVMERVDVARFVHKIFIVLFNHHH